MGNPKAFLSINRKEAGYRPVHERVADFGEVEQTLNSEDRKLQASRCMDCGVPFCHWACPLGNRIPEWQDHLHKGEWIKAMQILTSTNDFPEFTGRICPALCEKSCVLSLQQSSLTCRENEVAIIEKAFLEGYIKPTPPATRTGKRVAVVGSGPAGLTVANRLNKLGHEVMVYEKNAKSGGLLRYGIPDFKLNKSVIDRRIRLMEAEGVQFCNNQAIGHEVAVDTLQKEFDAVCLAIGSEHPRDLQVAGRELSGIYPAMTYLAEQNRLCSGELSASEQSISAKGKHILVIGGGDTGSDCVGTAIRQGAASVTQIEIMTKPPVGVNDATPWPQYPNVLKTSSSHVEGCERMWSKNTVKFEGDASGNVTSATLQTVSWSKGEDGRMQMSAVQGSEEVVKADLVLLALGFVHPIKDGVIESLNLATDNRGNIATDNNLMTSSEGVFAAGDAATGQSLVVKAIERGRTVAQAIDAYLKTKAN